MSKKKRSHVGTVVFYGIFAVFLIALVIVFFRFFNIVDEYTYEFESSSPYNVVEDYITRLQAGKFDTTLKFSGFTPSEFCSEEDFIGLMRQTYPEGSNISYFESTSYEGKNRMRYNLYIGEERVGYVILEKTGNVTSHGFDTWQICETQSVSGTDEYTITVPLGYSVYVNGKHIDENHITDTYEAEDYPVFNDIPAPTFITYRVGGFLSEPSFEFIPLNEEEFDCITSDDGKTVTCSRRAVFGEEVSLFVTEAMNSYIETVGMQYPAETFLEYVLKKSDYAARFKKYHSDWKMTQPPYENIEVTDMIINSYKEYSPNQAIADISFDYKVKTIYKEIITHGSFSVLLLRTDSGWKIADMINN